MAALLLALLGASSAHAADLSGNCQANNSSDPLQVNCVFSGAGDYALPVGPNVTQASVDAIGAAGGSPTWIDGSTVSLGGSGGSGAEVTGDVSFPAGTGTLYVLVGGVSQENIQQPGFDSPGGFNGGGPPGSTTYSGLYYGTFLPGGGGGASDIRTIDGGQSGSLDSRLIVAAGGGGGGLSENGSNGGNGGDAGSAGQSAGNGGGGAGTQSAGGAGGSSGQYGGGTGALGVAGGGGAGEGTCDCELGGGGGGGGGGYYGGGGGGGGNFTSGGGGGGGSNLVPSGGTASLSSSPASVTVSYERAATTTSVAASPFTGDVYGQNVTLTATVSSAAGTPDGGTVTFSDGGTTLGTASVDTTTGQATLSTTTLGGGGHSFTASYGGDDGFGASDSTANPVSYTVAADTTTTTTAVSQPSSSYDVPATVTATVTAANGGSVNGGTVQFYDGAATVGSPVGVSNGQASLNLQGLLSAGTHQLSATYSGDASTGPSTSGQVAETVTLEPTDVSMYPTSGQFTSSWGQSIQFSVQFGPFAYDMQNYLMANPSDGGSLQLYDGTTPVGPPEQLNFFDFSAFSPTSISVPSPAAGAHTYHVVFSGNGAFASSDSGQYYEPTTTVNNVPSTTTVTSSLGANTALGQAPTLTATVTRADGVTPTGTVQFTDDGEPLGSPVTLDDNGDGTLNPGPLPLGANAIAATYSPGDPYTQGGSSQPVSQTVNPLSTTTSVSNSPASLEGGDAVTLTAKITVQNAPATGPGSEAPTGTVTFSDGQTELGTAPVSADGSATLALPAGLSVGAHVITASYGGDTDHAASAIGPTAVVIHRDATALALAQGTLDSDDDLTLTASLTQTDTNSGLVPSGTVSFYDGSALLGTAALSGGTATGAGTATFRLTSLTAGDHAFQAVYSGDSQFSGATSSGQPLHIAAPIPPSATPNPTPPSSTPDPPSLTPRPTAAPRRQSGRVVIVSERRYLSAGAVQVRLYCAGNAARSCEGEVHIKTGPESAYDIKGGKLKWVTVKLSAALQAHVGVHGATYTLVTVIPRKQSGDSQAPARAKKWVIVVEAHDGFAPAKARRLVTSR